LGPDSRSPRTCLPALADTATGTRERAARVHASTSPRSAESRERKAHSSTPRASVHVCAAPLPGVLTGAYDLLDTYMAWTAYICAWTARAPGCQPDISLAAPLRLTAPLTTATPRHRGVSSTGGSPHPTGMCMCMCTAAAETRRVQGPGPMVHRLQRRGATLAPGVPRGAAAGRIQGPGSRVHGPWPTVQGPWSREVRASRSLNPQLAKGASREGPRSRVHGPESGAQGGALALRVGGSLPHRPAPLPRPALLSPPPSAPPPLVEMMAGVDGGGWWGHRRGRMRRVKTTYTS